MFTQIKIENFKGVPYLQTSDLVKHKNGTIKLSTKKPNILVGPNGSGKSALLTALAIKTMSFFTGISQLDPKMTKTMHEHEDWWSTANSWPKEWEFLQGLTTKGDGAPASYYRPAHIPGNGESIAYSMMTGYFDEARAHGKLIDDKSSGQQCAALLKRLVDLLDGTRPLPQTFGFHKDWDKGALARQKKTAWSSPMPWDCKGAVLEAMADAAAENPGIPLVMMDEPEQSLDAKSEIGLWKSIRNADCTKMQLIIATHSMHPFMHPQAFNMIESVPGYIEEVQSLL